MDTADRRTQDVPGLRLQHRRAVDATFAQLTGGSGGDPVAAAVKEPWDAFWGQRYAVIADPDGNTVDLFAALG